MKKCYLVHRMFGVILAGILMVESCFPVIASEADSPVVAERILAAEEAETLSDENTSEEGVTNEESFTEESTSETVLSEETVSEEISSEEIFTEELITEEVYSEKKATEDRAVALQTEQIPTGLTVTEKKADSVTLQWNTLEGCTGYKVFRSTSENGEYQLLESGTVTTTSNKAAYTDTTCVLGQIYFYKVLAYTTSEDGTVYKSPYSEVVNNATALQDITLNKTESALEKGEEEKITLSFIPEYTTDPRTINWSSDNEKVVTVVDGKVIAVGAGTAVVTAEVGGKSATCTVTVSVPLQQIVLDKAEVTLERGKTDTLTLIYQPEDTTDNKDIVWMSSNEAVVKVEGTANKEGRATVTAVAAGEADITAQVGDKTVTCHYKVVVPATEITLSEKNIELLETADEKEISISVLPEDTTDTVLTWNIEDSELVDVAVSDNRLTVTSKGILGSTKITIHAGKKTAVLDVSIVVEKDEQDTTVQIIPVEKVQIDTGLSEEDISDVLNLEIGDELLSERTITAKVMPENATDKKLSWSSSDNDVATVTEQGVVTAVGIGYAVISATAENGVFDSVAVKVMAAEDKEFYLDDEVVTIYCNDNMPDGVNNTHEIDIETNGKLSFEFRSSDINVAKVSQDGIITAISPGKTTITVLAKETGKSDTMTVTVKRIIETVTFLRNEITVIAGTTQKVGFTVAPENISQDSLNTFDVRTSNEKILSSLDWEIGQKGGEITFYAEKAGNATLSITAGDVWINKKGTVKVSSVKQTIAVKVIEAPKVKIASMKLSGQAKMKSATKQVLEVSGYDSDKNVLDIEQLETPIAYTSSDEEIVTVDNQGTVFAKKGGKAVVTAYALDGSNQKVSFTITVEQRPEEIQFARGVYGVSKAANATATVTLNPIILPVTTASGCKSVSWEIVDVKDAKGTTVSGKFSDYFTINTAGKVTVQKSATNGMRAVVRCTSKAYSASEASVSGTVEILVQEKRVQSVKFKSANMQLVGLREQVLEFSTVFAKGFTEVEGLYTATSSDNEIAEVIAAENGEVKIVTHKYGTATITLCADNNITATSKITVYPVAKGALQAQASSYYIQQARYDGTDRVMLRFVDAKTKKTVIDPELFTYQSSNPDIVYVDETGTAYANPSVGSKLTNKNNQVTITATLKDDPDKRKATTKVIVCLEEQIARMNVLYYADSVDAKNNRNAKTLSNQGMTMTYSQGNYFVLQIAAYGVNNENIVNAKLGVTSSDTGIATVGAPVRKTISEAGNKNNKKEVWEVIVKVNKPGRFSINLEAKDQKKLSESIPFSVYSGIPILMSDYVGVVNKNTDTIEIDKTSCIVSEQTFTLVGADGTEIKNVSVAKPVSIKVKEAGVNKTKSLPGNAFRVNKKGENIYQLVVSEAALANSVDGTYSIVLQVERSKLPNEKTGSDVEIGSGEYVKTELMASFKISNQLPKLNNAKVTLNSFIRGDKVKIPIDTKEEIEKVEIVNGMMLANEVTVSEEEDGWYVCLKESAFANWKKASTSGKLSVKLKGYANPVHLNLTVNTKETKPVVKQQSVPSLQLVHGDTTSFALMDAQKQIWTDYKISCKDSSTKTKFIVKEENGKVKVTFQNPDIKLSKQGTQYTEKVLVKKDEWRSPIEVPVSIKVYNGTSVPTVKFTKSTININKYIGETEAKTDVVVSMSNVQLNEGEWTISDSCKYKVVNNKKTEWHQCSEAFKAVYEAGELKVQLLDSSIPNGTYKLTMTKLWDKANDEGLKMPLTTATLSVVVKNTAPVVKINLSGKLDLVNRSNSTLQGTVTISDANSSINTIRLGEDLEDSFYCVRKDNTFKIYARSAAILKTQKVTGTVHVMLADGNELMGKISFTPTQSVPKVITPANQRIYKSSAKYTVVYDFNKDLADGVKISKIEAVSAPKGITVQDSNGNLLVTLQNKTLKAGKYTIKVNVYFKGAQEASGNALGKPVAKTIYVEVKE